MTTTDYFGKEGMMAAVGEGPFKEGLAGRAADEVQARSLYEQDILLWVEDTVIVKSQL